jgi:N-acyl-D-amino-acid deacylase
MAADITVFDPDTVKSRQEDIVHDFPAGGWRFRGLADGVHYTIVNGQVLLEEGQHTGARPGRVVRNFRYNAGMTV